MTPREIMKRTLEFDGPARIPRNLWTLPWSSIHYPNETAALMRDFPSDLGGAPNPYPRMSKEMAEAYGDNGTAYRIGSFTDEWGCTFITRQKGVWGEVKDPIIKTWDDLDKVRIPEEYLELNVESINAFCRNTDLFCVSSMGFGEYPRPFERLQFLRGTQNVMIDIMEQTPEFLALLKQMHEFYCNVLERWAKTDVDALLIMDDWGSQRSLLIPPDVWRAIFKPLYKEYIDIAHRHGKYIFMHSDGYILDIYSDLIELGLDAVNSQIFCMGLETLSQFRGQITFWGEIDRQHLLRAGTLPEVSAAVHNVFDNLYANGGVIAQCEFTVGAKPENVRQVFETWSRISNSLRACVTAN